MIHINLPWQTILNNLQHIQTKLKQFKMIFLLNHFLLFVFFIFITFLNLRSLLFTNDSLILWKFCKTSQNLKVISRPDIGSDYLTSQRVNSIHRRTLNLTQIGEFLNQMNRAEMKKELRIQFQHIRQFYRVQFLTNLHFRRYEFNQFVIPSQSQNSSHVLT